MVAAALPADEVPRLARLRALSVLDTGAEPLFDALATAAARATGMPIALIALVDAERQWFKANVGLAGVSETPREIAFCAHTILGTQLLEVADARQDPRFSDNPMVTGAPYVRFYAGAPIALRDGMRVGSLCVIGGEPHVLGESQREVLAALARTVAEALELRMQALKRQAELDRKERAARRQRLEKQEVEQRLQASQAFLDRIGRLAGIGGWEFDLQTQRLTWSDETCRLHELPAGYQPTLEEAIGFYAPEAQPRLRAAIDKAVAKGTGWDIEVPLTTAKGRDLWVRAAGSVKYDDDGHPRQLVGAFQDITIRRRVTLALEASDRRFRKLFEYSLGLICTHDHEGMLLSINTAGAGSLGYSVGELLGRPLTDFIQPERHGAFREYLLRIMKNDRDSGLLQLLAKDGSLRMWQYQNVLDDDGDEPYVLVHAQDITERHQHELQLLELSIRDPLTGCFNRRFLAELVAADSGTEAWGCVAIDLDHFKQVNDTWGHQRGDEVLVAMAHFLARHTRPGDAVVRLGGDEFLVLLRGADAPFTQEVVDRLEQDRADAPIAFTLGSAIFGKDVSLEQGLAEADRRLYQKRATRTR